MHLSEHTFAWPIDSESLGVRLKAGKGDLQKVMVLYKNIYDHSSPPARKPMKHVARTSEHDWFEAVVSLPGKRFKYCFELDDGLEAIFYTADGFVSEPKESRFFFYPYINESDRLLLPGWAEGEIIYQVWVDRFFDGNPRNNPLGTKPWDAIPDRNTYYGGDFEGLIMKLDSLIELGVKALYLSPLFQSNTYHKYDVVDYTKVEEIYGGKEGLRNLVDAAHEKGMKVILDAVFNHCSDQHPFFQDVRKHQERSRYSKWFTIHKFPIEDPLTDYDSFGGLIPSMPRFNTDHPEVIDYLVGIALHWTTELNLDGWRLDVADEVSHELWREFRKRLRKANPDLLIIGEIWNQAGRWLLGDELDSITNYKYMNALREFAIGDIDANLFWEKMDANRMLYKTPVHNYLVNLVGSHDTIRNRRYVKDERLHELMLLVTLSLPGMPLIYYGDEIAMDGGEDPDNRRAMQWGQNEAFRFRIAKMGHIRSRSEVLKKGDMEVHDGGPRVLVFSRRLRDQQLIAIANFDHQPTSPILFDTELSPLFGMASIEGKQVRLEGRSFVLLSKASGT